MVTGPPVFLMLHSWVKTWKLHRDMLSKRWRKSLGDFTTRNSACRRGSTMWNKKVLDFKVPDERWKPWRWRQTTNLGNPFREYEDSEGFSRAFPSSNPARS
jgi:hypothetical protein